MIPLTPSKEECLSEPGRNGAYSAGYGTGGRSLLRDFVSAERGSGSLARVTRAPSLFLRLRSQAFVTVSIFRYEFIRSIWDSVNQRWQRRTYNKIIATDHHHLTHGHPNPPAKKKVRKLIWKKSEELENVLTLKHFFFFSSFRCVWVNWPWSWTRK